MQIAASAGEHLVTVVLHPNVAATDVTGPMEAFGLANYISGRNFYTLGTVTLGGATVPVAGSYFHLTPTYSFETLPERIDTLLIAGGPNAKEVGSDPAMVAALRAVGPRCARFGSVCNGTYILCATGRTRGQTVATHWFYVDDLARLYPETHVDGDAVFIRSGDIWTSAGMTTGIDLALAMIEADLGRKLALEVARHMVLYLQRTGGQSQFSMHLKAQFIGEPSIERVQHFILDNLDKTLSVDELAEVAHISRRSLHRAFRDKVGKTIGDYVADARLRFACSLLEHSDKGFKEIAASAGLGTDANLRKVFMRHLGISPAIYRERFQIEAGAGGAASSTQDNWRHVTTVEQGQVSWTGSGQGRG